MILIQAYPCGAGVANCNIAAVVSKIPQTQTREMESMLKIENNQIAVMGGLMQDEINNQADEIPFFGRIPFFGNLFKYRNDTNVKSELVIFLRPVVIKDGNLDGDYSQFRDSLPNANFFKDGAKQTATQEKQKP
ncbi:MAG: hypothetical protein Q8O24_02295 [Gallionellaceae bacterium]|nr:hypothetical protein [Gallionellaceae bacterium]